MPQPPEPLAPITVDCNDLSFATGTDMVQHVARIRTWLDAGTPVTLLDPPQLLLHNLYRVHRYPHPLLTILGQGDAEAYG